MLSKKSFLSLFFIVLFLFSVDAYMEAGDVLADYRSRGIEVYSVESGDLTENADLRGYLDQWPGCGLPQCHAGCGTAAR